ncbi:MAG: ABC transporter ATP-binding protein, partial [Desulfomonile tiedjei]|nr:ABC transporter ATP-binding protein [Desulfomonile tiedjei]
AIGRAMMSKPKLLMMDEPSLGLAPMVAAEVFRIIEQIRNDGVTIFLIEQNANAALKIADYAYLLDTGKIVLEGSGAQLLNDPKIKQAYLGEALESDRKDL